MKIEIKNRYTEGVIYSHDCESNNIKITVIEAVRNKVKLSEANLSRADLSEVDLSRADLSRASLYGANLSEADLSRADLSEADLSRASLYGASLYGADLSRASLARANLSEANLSRADLSIADLSRASLSEADLSRASLSRADLYGCIGNMIELCSMQIETYSIAFTKDILQIGCKRYSHKEWFDFRTDIIDEMDINAIVFWEKYKDFIFKAIELRFGVKYA